ncbi:ankyrin repeat-containing domain protein [Schizophyllum amplum]|uniref:Ankyrin repeat-containing domain protein n=1 Tax=Schizophyllum amplum TaxID=97359 RepID=A0A550C7Z5_9AGAR|nr:ankyrin repeat-containing domain protein [Auriculariopsis ampla]
MHLAAQCNNTTRLLLDAGADINIRDRVGRTALTWLSYCFMAPASPNESFRLLLEAGADVNTRDDDGRTPLHHTIHALFYFHQADPLSTTAGGKAMVRLLLSAGADRDARDDCGNSPVDLAEERMESVVHSWDRPDMEEVIGLLRQPPVTHTDTNSSGGMGEGPTDGENRQDTRENVKEQSTAEPAGAACV